MRKNDKFSQQRKISSNQFFSTLFRKTVNFTKFLPKMHEREFPLFPHCVCCALNDKFNALSPKQYFSSNQSSFSYSCNQVDFTKFLRQNCGMAVKFRISMMHNNGKLCPTFIFMMVFQNRTTFLLNMNMPQNEKDKNSNKRFTALTLENKL